MFLQLLVAQLKYQDPTNPTDSTQFVSQLAQFSELDQVLAIRQDTDSLATSATAAAASSTATGTTPTGGTPSTSTTPGS
jgi:flagellar basal-body rod modification protein FlgD